MGLQVGRIDRDRLGLGVCSSQVFHYAQKHVPLAPPFPAVVQRLVRSISAGRGPPPQPIAIDETMPLNTCRSLTQGLL
jgi:hypothetical protein